MMKTQDALDAGLPRGQIRFVAVGRKSDGASGAVVVASHVFYTAGSLPAK
jgi:hypothetical protein